jgi:hypothetical protein
VNYIDALIHSKAYILMLSFDPQSMDNIGTCTVQHCTNNQCEQHQPTNLHKIEQHLHQKEPSSLKQRRNTSRTSPPTHSLLQFIQDSIPFSLNRIQIMSTFLFDKIFSSIRMCSPSSLLRLKDKLNAGLLLDDNNVIIVGRAKANDIGSDSSHASVSDCASIQSTSAHKDVHECSDCKPVYTYINRSCYVTSAILDLLNDLCAHLQELKNRKSEFVSQFNQAIEGLHNGNGDSDHENDTSDSKQELQDVPDVQGHDIENSVTTSSISAESIKTWKSKQTMTSSSSSSNQMKSTLQSTLFSTKMGMQQFRQHQVTMKQQYLDEKSALRNQTISNKVQTVRRCTLFVCKSLDSFVDFIVADIQKCCILYRRAIGDADSKS